MDGDYLQKTKRRSRGSLGFRQPVSTFDKEKWKRRAAWEVGMNMCDQGCVDLRFERSDPANGAFSFRVLIGRGAEAPSASHAGTGFEQVNYCFIRTPHILFADPQLQQRNAIPYEHICKTYNSSSGYKDSSGTLPC
jgi:hypothetical protein